MNNNKTALITGATSGIGYEVARNLAQLNYSIIILGRSPDKLDSLSKILKDIRPEVKIDTKICDLSSLKDISDTCEEMKTSGKSIDLMILNAGIWNFQFIESGDKIEETLHVNLIAPLLMYSRLKNLIPKNGESKVIFTSSGLHQGVIEFKDIEFRSQFSGFKSYRQSKLGVIMMARWLSNQEENAGIAFYSVHPGMVNTNLGRRAGWFSRIIFKLFGKSKEKGAETHMYLIKKKNAELKSGAYYANCKVERTTEYSYNMPEAEKLWNVITEFMNKVP